MIGAACLGHRAPLRYARWPRQANPPAAQPGFFGTLLNQPAGPFLLRHSAQNLSAAHNIVAGNDFYTTKQAEYGKSGNYLTRSLVALTDVGQNTSISRINAKLEAFPAWNSATVEKRHAMLIALAQDVWKTTPIDN